MANLWVVRLICSSTKIDLATRREYIGAYVKTVSKIPIPYPLSPNRGKLLKSNRESKKCMIARHRYVYGLPISTESICPLVYEFRIRLLF